MNRKKVIRIVIRILLLPVAVLFLFMLSTWIHHRVKTGHELELLKEKGYYNPVSVGAYSLNVARFGKEQGGHTVVALAGIGMGDFPVVARRMTAHLEDDNSVVFVDRAGYGLSDDTGREMTLEHIVKAYRAALKNAGIEPPYVLLAHSIGGMYASWWTGKYPGEIEAAVFLDGTQLSESAYDDEPDSAVTFEDRALAFLAKIGFSRYSLRNEHYLYPDPFSEEEQVLGDALDLMTQDSVAPVSESALRRRNARTAWSGIVANDIPKLYVCSSWGARTKEDLIERNRWLNGQIARNHIDQSLLRTDFDDETAEEILNRMVELRQTILSPYADRMGNCRIVLLPGIHAIYEQKPDACGELVKDFLSTLPAE